MNNKLIYCVNCKTRMQAELCTGADIYKNRPDLSNKRFYKCPICGNYVGTHFNGEPLGSIPTPELRQARIKTHNYIDSFWKSGKYSRKYIYQILSKTLGYTYHTGLTRSIDECENAIEIIKKEFDSD